MCWKISVHYHQLEEITRCKAVIQIEIAIEIEIGKNAKTDFDCDLDFDFEKDIRAMIRPAEPDDAAALTGISFASKGYWGYPEEYFKIWKNELTISRDYIEKNTVYVYEIFATIVGYYSIVALPEEIDLPGTKLPKGFWLEHMFINPRHIGKGIGSTMFRHLRDRCRKIGICEVGILSDPHSRGFYEKMGCRYIREFPSTINNRTTPYLILRP